MDAGLLSPSAAAGATAPTPAAGPRILHLENLGDELQVYWQDGVCSPFLALWLRDNGPRVDTHLSLHPHASDPALFPDRLLIGDVRVAAEGDLLVRFEPEGLTFRFPPAWLRAHGDAAGDAERDPRVSWNADLSGRIPEETYRELSECDDTLARWLHGIRVHGVGLLRNLPPTRGMLLRVVERFGHARRIEAGACFDTGEHPFEAAQVPDRAGRQPHTAAPYRDPVPGLQLLHCLSPAPSGGQSVLVDGLRAAAIVARHHPVYHGLLARIPVRFERDGPRHRHAARRAMIDLDAAGALNAVHYDPAHTAPLDLDPRAVRDYYSAYCCFARTLNRTDLRLRLELRSGDVLVIDNRRVLHGHAAWQGKRQVEHCYADWGDLESRWRAVE